LNKVNDHGLLIVDIQGKLAQLVHNSASFLQQTRKLIQCCQQLHLPIVVLEQNPEGLGTTTPELAEILGATARYSKCHFNGFAEEHIQLAIKKAGKKHWLVAGIEAHICVYQTVTALKNAGYEPKVLRDCIASREAENIQLAIDNMRNNNISISGFEMAIYQLMASSEHPAFRDILRIIKS